VDRFYVVVRADLVPAQQAVQGMHAQRLFVEEHKEVEQAWYRTSNTIVLLAVPGPAELAQLRIDAEERGLRISAFEEPDLNDAVTALALEPKARKLLRGLPRALEGR